MAAEEPLSLTPEEFRRLGHAVVDRLAEHLAALDGLAPVAPADSEWTHGRIPPCPDGPSDPTAALEYLFSEILPRGQLGNHPRFFARIPGPSNPLSVLADLAGTGINVFAGSWTGGAGVSALELAVLGWMRDWMGMPMLTEGVLVSGGSEGTLTALAAAAHAQVEDRRAATAYVSEHTHAAVGRAWRVLGFEPAHLRVLRPDTGHRLSVAAVEAAVAIDREAHLEPFCLVATAGNTSTGAVDPLADLAGVAAREGLWLHVDGAYGAPVRLTDRGRDLLTGIEQADSLVLDPHKWLFQPYEIGAVLVREPGLLERTFALEHGVYLRDTGGGAVEFRERSPLLTRSSRALKLWLSLQVFGLDAFRAGIAHGIAMAEYAEALLRERGGWEIVSPATLAIVCFRREGHDDEQTDAMVRAVVADGYAAPSTTVLDGRTVARLCTINPRTTEDDIRGTIERLEKLSR